MLSAYPMWAFLVKYLLLHEKNKRASGLLDGKRSPLPMRMHRQETCKWVTGLLGGYRGRGRNKCGTSHLTPWTKRGSIEAPHYISSKPFGSSSSYSVALSLKIDKTYEHFIHGEKLEEKSRVKKAQNTFICIYILSAITERSNVPVWSEM